MNTIDKSQEVSMTALVIRHVIIRIVYQDAYHNVRLKGAHPLFTSTLPPRKAASGARHLQLSEGLALRSFKLLSLNTHTKHHFRIYSSRRIYLKMPFKTINSKSLFYTDTPSTSSSPNAHTALFIHGLGSSSCFYSTIIPSLTSQTRCIALDTPGSGLSTLGAKEQSIKTIAEDALALLDALNVKEEVVVVGHSMGGIVASVMAEMFKERVKGVVLLGPVNPAEGLRDVFGKRVEVVKAGTIFIAIPYFSHIQLRDWLLT